MHQNKSLAKCRRQKSGSVVKQNSFSIGICGDRKGVICQDQCALFFSSSDIDRPLLKRHKLLGNEYYDVLAYPENNSIVTLLFPLEKSPDQIHNIIENSTGLTCREREIAEFILKGFSNRQICKKLFISQNTLKTHINRIYRKVGEAKILFNRAGSQN